MTAALDSLPPQIDAIASYTHGPDLHLAEGRHDYAVVADFADADGWRVYDTHPAHEKARADVIFPLVAHRVAVQFELRSAGAPAAATHRPSEPLARGGGAGAPPGRRLRLLVHAVRGGQ